VAVLDAEQVHWIRAQFSEPAVRALIALRGSASSEGRATPEGIPARAS
jgi:hypothetical protein